MSKVSVIVPTYNGEKTLGRCLDSILNQTYGDLEIILINDGSTDGSLQKCREYAYRDSRIIVIDQPNCGVSSARNAGIERATGEYLAFVDSDDYLDLTMYERLVAKAEKDVLDLVVCKFLVVHEESNRIEKMPYNGLEEGVMNRNIGKFLIGGNAKAGGVPTYVWCALYRKSTIEQLRFDTDIMYGEDTIFFLWALWQADRRGCIDEYLYYYVVNGNEYETVWNKYVSKPQYIPSRIKRAQIFFDLFYERGFINELEFALFDEFKHIVWTSCIKDRDYKHTIATVLKEMPYNVFTLKKCYKSYKKFMGGQALSQIC